MKNSQNAELTPQATARPAPQAVGVKAWHVLSFEVVKDRVGLGYEVWRRLI